MPSIAVQIIVFFMVLCWEPKPTICIFPSSTLEPVLCLSVIPWWRRMEKMQLNKFCVIVCKTVSALPCEHTALDRGAWKQHWRKDLQSRKCQLSLPQTLKAQQSAGTAALGFTLFTTQSCVSSGTQQFYGICSPELGWRLSPAFKDTRQQDCHLKGVLVPTARLFLPGQNTRCGNVAMDESF